VRTFAFYWLPLMSYAGLMFYLSSLPHPPQPLIFFTYDKTLHVVEYAILGMLVINLLQKYFPDQRKRRLTILAVVLSTLYGITDEFHQYFTPFRDASVFDVCADGIGSLFGVSLYFIVKRGK